MQTLLRMDSLIFGVLFVGIKHYYKDLYLKITKISWLLFSLSFLGLILCCFYFSIYYSQGIFDKTVFPRTLYLSIIPLFSVLLVVSLESKEYQSKFFSYKLVIHFINITSTKSYSTYLIHYGILKNILKIYSYYKMNINKFVLWIIALIIIYLLSWTLYMYIESTILKIKYWFAYIKRSKI